MKVVLIEDERDHAKLARHQLEAALVVEFPREVEILPPQSQGRLSYESMEAFAQSEEGQDRSMRAVIVVDLFLLKRGKAETPNGVFHQLMYNFYFSPVDCSVVCGRLGVLSKLKEHYPNVDFEVYTYFPTYFSSLNEEVYDDKFVFTSYDPDRILKLARDQETKFAEFLRLNRIAGQEFIGSRLLMVHAMRQALYERLQGIGCTEPFDRVTVGAKLEAEARRFGSASVPVGTAKTDSRDDDVGRLVTKVLEKLRRLRDAVR